MTAAVEDLLSPSHLATVARVRTVCTTAGVAGAGASMAANMLASDGTSVGLAVGVIAPGAFILASEIASAASSLPRTRGTRPLLTALVGLLVVIGVSAAVVSFGHLREVVAGVGESLVAEVLIAIVVDAVAVMGLVGHRLTGLYLNRHHAAVEAGRQVERADAARAAAEEAAAVERARKRAESSTARSSSRSAKPAPAAGTVAGDDRSLPAPERARAIAVANPSMTQAEIAAVIGRGERTVRRYLAAATTTEPDTGTSDGSEGGSVGDGVGEGRRPGLAVV